ncbi:MAG: hypothetical protein EG822_10240 [Deltaproteobacteria bacterium]|nr:hypothetical protein [Deltaproteobacteria bacterium]TLN04111.1 MAG: hypothetical protein FDZ73_05240 [bacterium]
MTRLVITALFALLASSCAASRPIPVATVIPPNFSIPPDYELQDVRELPQDFGRLSSAVTSLDKACQESLLSEFRRKYYAPWSVSPQLSDLPRSILTMKEHAGRDWYGENRRKVPRKILDQLLANSDLEHFPAMNSRAIAIVPTSMRVLPTADPFLVKADDFPFDELQNAGLKMNEPIRVLHFSADGVWAFAETADANGWVPMRDIGFIRESMAAEWAKKDQIVIVEDFAPIRESREHLAFRAKAGTLFPLAGESEDAFEVSVAVQSVNNGVREITVRVPKASARRFPLELSTETATLIGNQLIGKPYGWGELFQGRDCSALMRDFFLPFGIWLPRGSYNQIHSGRYISLSGLNNSEKERFIREKGVPFLTLLHMNGHIMLYAGSVGEKALIFHSLWKVKVKDREGQDLIQVVGKSIISTLTPGSELPLANGTLLEKIGSMLVLRDRCGVPR